MANKYHRGEVETPPVPTLRGKPPALPMEKKTMAWPKLPGSPRKVFKPLGKRIKLGASEDM